jgi:AraC-like DNA-binding protein/mannose-6-phosphate isomerase-like protein (cupin superfamily)
MIKFNYEAERDVVHNLHCINRENKGIWPHFHQSIEIGCILKGCSEVFIGNKSMVLNEGQIFFVPPYFNHYSLSEEGFEFVMLVIPKKYYEEFENEIGGKTYSFLPDVEKNKPIRILLESLRDDIGNLNELMRKAYANMVLGLISRLYEPEEMQTDHKDISLDIIHYIDEHYMEKITLDSISQYFGYSKYYFSRLFNRLFHCSLNSYINSVRLRAIEEMSNKDNKTNKITKAGFNSLSSYYRSKK